MRKLAVALALASTALSTPAVARDNSPYVGIEGGVLFVDDLELDFEEDGDEINNALTIHHKNTGLDLDAIAGYDFGAFKVEGELGYKRASLDRLQLNSTLVGGPGQFDLDGRVRVLSAMINGLLDFESDRWSGGAGAGVGLASVKYSIDDADDDFVDGSSSDSGIAWQLISQVHYAVSPNIDVGLKYRFFNAGRLRFGDGPDRSELRGKWKSHSLLASLIYNFAAPPPPPPPPVIVPPPPPPAPATQVCPDGSVILATEICPAPPPPPPPPPPAPERG